MPLYWAYLGIYRPKDLGPGPCCIRLCQTHLKSFVVQFLKRISKITIRQRLQTFMNQDIFGPYVYPLDALD